jgi:hypothetical protein
LLFFEAREKFPLVGKKKPVFVVGERRLKPLGSSEMKKRKILNYNAAW